MRRECDIGVARGPSAESASDTGAKRSDHRNDDGTSGVSADAARAYSSPRIQRSDAGEPAGAPTGVEWGKAPVVESDRLRVAIADEDVLKVGGWHDVLARPVRGRHVSEYPIDHDALLYDGRWQTVYHLNTTAYYVWRHCDGRPIDEIANALSEEFGVARETAIEHVREVIELLSIGGLLTGDTPTTLRV